MSWAKTFETLFGKRLSAAMVAEWEQAMARAKMEKRRAVEIEEALHKLVEERQDLPAEQRRFAPSCEDVIGAMKAARRRWAQETYGPREGSDAGEVCPYCAADGQHGPHNTGWMTHITGEQYPCVCAKGQSEAVRSYPMQHRRDAVARASQRVKARLDAIQPRESLEDMTPDEWELLKRAPRGKFDNVWQEARERKLFSWHSGATMDMRPAALYADEQATPQKKQLRELERQMERELDGRMVTR